MQLNARARWPARTFLLGSNPTQSPGFNPKTQRRVPSGRRHIVNWPSGGATGIASSNGTSSPSIIQPVAVEDVRV